jgi:response regulator RpfG family c-di-GMP phosphodiesterase
VDSDPDYAFRGYAAGAVDFIAKPFDPWVLRAKVSVFVDLHHKSRQLREQAALLREQAALLRTKLTDTNGNGAAAQPGDEGPAAHVSSRLTAVEEQVAVLTQHAPPGLENVIDELDSRVAELRIALEGLNSGAPESAG